MLADLIKIDKEVTTKGVIKINTKDGGFMGVERGLARRRLMNGDDNQTKRQRGHMTTIEPRSEIR